MEWNCEPIRELTRERKDFTKISIELSLLFNILFKLGGHDRRML